MANENSWLGISVQYMYVMVDCFCRIHHANGAIFHPNFSVLNGGTPPSLKKGTNRERCLRLALPRTFIVRCRRRDLVLSRKAAFLKLVRRQPALLSTRVSRNVLEVTEFFRKEMGLGTDQISKIYCSHPQVRMHYSGALLSLASRKEGKKAA